MFKKNMRIIAALSLLVLVVLVAGCGGSSGLQRIAGLSAEDTVKTFFDAAKNSHMDQAALYVSAASKSDPQTVLKFMTGQSVAQIKNSSILSIKQLAQQGNYAAMVVTTQEQNSLNLTIKPVGLEKVNGEWYIIDADQVFKDAKYIILQQLLSKI